MAIPGHEPKRLGAEGGEGGVDERRNVGGVLLSNCLPFVTALPCAFQSWPGTTPDTLSARLSPSCLGSRLLDDADDRDRRMDSGETDPQVPGPPLRRLIWVYYLSGQPQRHHVTHGESHQTSRAKPPIPQTFSKPRRARRLLQFIQYYRTPTMASARPLVSVVGLDGNATGQVRRFASPKLRRRIRRFCGARLPFEIGSIPPRDRS